MQLVSLEVRVWIRIHPGTRGCLNAFRDKGAFFTEHPNIPCIKDMYILPFASINIKYIHATSDMIKTYQLNPSVVLSQKNFKNIKNNFVRVRKFNPAFFKQKNGTRSSFSFSAPKAPWIFWIGLQKRFGGGGLAQNGDWVCDLCLFFARVGSQFWVHGAFGHQKKRLYCMGNQTGINHTSSFFNACNRRSQTSPHSPSCSNESIQAKLNSTFWKAYHIQLHFNEVHQCILTFQW